jgi:hypothetical protein
MTGAFLDRDLEIVAHPHRQLVQRRCIRALPHEAVPHLTKGAEVRAPVFRIVGEGRQQHQTDEPARSAPRGRADNRRQLRFARAVLRRFPREVDLNQQVDPPPGFDRAFVELAHERRVVDGVHDVETRRRLLCFVRLQVANEVPPQRKLRGAVDLRQRLLDLVFAEVDLTGGCRRADRVGRKCFGDSDEADGCGIAARPAGGPRDARADLVQPGADCVGIEHYVFVRPDKHRSS